ncbi:MAG: TIGR01906 family membrane protein [Dehalococcoidia bacterium]
MRWFARAATAFYVIALPLLLITTNVRFLAGEVRLYERGFREYDAAERTGLALPELDRAAREVIDYFENDSATLRILVTRDGEEISLYNARETAHMKDVKALIRAVFRLNEISLAYVLTYIAAVFLWAGAGSSRRLAVETLGGIGVGVLVVGVVGAFAITGFDAAWSQFHELFFSSGSWTFNPATDRLIQMFPEPFWQEETYILAALTVAEAVVLAVASVSLLVFARGKGGPSAGDAPPAPRPARVQRVRRSRRAVQGE